MSDKFKVGDYVVCVIADPTEGHAGTVGQRYRVNAAEAYGLDLEPRAGEYAKFWVGCDPRRFELSYTPPETLSEAMGDHLPVDKQVRKGIPLATGCLDYFPDALAAVAELSRIGNDQHNPGEPLHWSRDKSDDHPDCLMRHFVERGTLDHDGVRHSTKVAWRALAALQLEIEAAKK